MVQTYQKTRNKHTKKEGNEKISPSLYSFPSYPCPRILKAFVYDPISLKDHIALINRLADTFAANYKICLVEIWTAGIL